MSRAQGTHTQFTARTEIVAYLARQLIGPADGTDEIVHDPPNRHYLMGTLFPQQLRYAEDEAATEGESGDIADDDYLEDPVALSQQFMPASLGISLLVSSAFEGECAVTGALYEKHGERSWRRKSLSEAESPETIPVKAPSGNASVRHSVLQGRAEVRLTWRNFGADHILTISLINTMTSTAESNGSGHVDPTCCIYQAGLSCTPVKGEIHAYPRQDASVSLLTLIVRDLPELSVIPRAGVCHVRSAVTEVAFCETGRIEADGRRDAT